MKTRMMSEIAFMSVLVFLFDLISHFLPIPGTTEGLSLYMVPIFLISFKHGVRAGMTTGILSSMLFLLFGHFHIFVWQQFLLDYILGLSVLGIAGIYKNKIQSCDCNCDSRSIYILSGIIYAVIIKYILFSLSIYLFVNEYFEHNSLFNNIDSSILFALLYAFIGIAPSAILSAIILVTSFKKYGNSILGM